MRIFELGWPSHKVWTVLALYRSCLPCGPRPLLHPHFWVSGRTNRHRSVSCPAVVALLAVLEVAFVCIGGQPRNLVHSLHPVVQVRVIHNELVVELEAVVVHWVVAEDGGEQTQVGYCQLLPNQEGLANKYLVEAIQCLEVLVIGSLIHVLVAGEACLVAAVVDVCVHPCIDAFDFVHEVGRKQVYIRAGSQRLERIIEHAHDFGTLVVNHSVGFLVEQDGNALLVVDACHLVYLFGQPLPGHSVSRALREGDAPASGSVHSVWSKLPEVGPPWITLRCAVGEANINGNDVLQAKDGAREENAVTPRAVETHNQVVAACLGRILCLLPRSSDPVPSCAYAAHKLAFRSARRSIRLVLLDTRGDRLLRLGRHSPNVSAGWQSQWEREGNTPINDTSRWYEV
mmetsp:Transcript_25348/g.70915  ORF Transcript_25348/g.70915 Transcript_25348/m.70915 type:complete len:400 (+) Transcript_25348:44-1243(+)